MLKKIKFLLKLIICLILIVAIFIAGVDLLVKLTTKSSIISAENYNEKADCIVILGAGVNPDGTPSLMLKERLDKGIQLYESGVSQKILISGDHRSKYYDEVNTMKSYCLKAGVSSKDIFMDHAGVSTYDSIYRAKEIFGAEKIVVVTQKYHLYRAIFIAKNLGLKATGIVCDKVVYRGQTYRNMREIIARNKDAIKCVFKPKAEVMGEKISLESDGNITND